MKKEYFWIAIGLICIAILNPITILVGVGLVYTQHKKLKEAMKK